MEDFNSVEPCSCDLWSYCLVDASFNVLDVFFEEESAFACLDDYCDCDGFSSVRIVRVNISSAIRFIFGV